MTKKYLLIAVLAITGLANGLNAMFKRRQDPTTGWIRPSYTHQGWKSQEPTYYLPSWANRLNPFSEFNQKRRHENLLLLLQQLDEEIKQSEAKILNLDTKRHPLDIKFDIYSPQYYREIEEYGRLRKAKKQAEKRYNESQESIQPSRDCPLFD